VKAVGIEAKGAALLIVGIEKDGDNVQVFFSDEWKASSDGDRAEKYVELRKRLVERLKGWNPDAVCVAPIEAKAISNGYPSVSWFKAAELRGVAAEAARSVCKDTTFRGKAQVSKRVGSRKRDAYLKDDNFWQELLGKKLAKKYRSTALLALSKLRESE
jgi:hypothetical protein